MAKEPQSTDPQLFVRVIENLDRAVLATDQAGHIVLFNPAAEVCTGLSRRQSIGRHYQDLFVNQPRIKDLIRLSLEEGRPISDDEQILLTRPHMLPTPVSISVSPIFEQGGLQDGIVLIIRDLTRLRELETALRQADRLSMLGTMAAGLAHEVKNPLGGIRGAAQLLGMELDSNNSPLTEYTDVVIREVARINDIIEELMDLTCPRNDKMGDTDISQILRDVVLLQKEAHRSRNLEFILQIDPSIPPIRGDEALLTRLLLNLVKNAAEAVNPGGRIEISTRIATDYHLISTDHKAVPWVVVEVADDGPGINSEDLDRIFTPFFTTKSQGTGLGLATCQKIADGHNGVIKARNRADKGSIFSVSIPFIQNLHKNISIHLNNEGKS
jgi:two-component system nitrogen regulation sensor histidine kinase GlnL